MKSRKKIICYPLKSGGSIWNNNELRYSLRSLDEHWKGHIDHIYLLSSIRPKWLSEEVEFIRSDGYMEAMHKASDLGDDIIWMNDDIYFLKDASWESVSKWKRGGKINKKQENRLLSSDNSWRRRLGETVKKLREMELETWKYSTHTPYFYESEKLKECLEIFERGYKTPIETAYGNYFKVDVDPQKDKLMRYSKEVMPMDLSSYRYFNHNNKGLGNHQRGFLMGRFWKKSRFEI